MASSPISAGYLVPPGPTKGEIASLKESAERLDATFLHDGARQAFAETFTNPDHIADFLLDFDLPTKSTEGKPGVDAFIAAVTKELKGNPRLPAFIADIRATFSPAVGFSSVHYKFVDNTDDGALSAWVLVGRKTDGEYVTVGVAHSHADV